MPFNTWTALKEANAVIGIFTNGLISYSIVKGARGRLHGHGRQPPRSNHDFIAAALSFCLLVSCPLLASVDLLMYLYHVEHIKDSTAICSYSAVVSLFCASIFLACLLCFAVELYYKVVRLGDISKKWLLITFLSILALDSMGIIITLSTGDREFGAFESVNVCFVRLVDDGGGPSSLSSGIILLLSMMGIINVIFYLYAQVFLVVRKVRLSVEESTKDVSASIVSKPLELHLQQNSSPQPRSFIMDNIEGSNSATPASSATRPNVKLSSAIQMERHVFALCGSLMVILLVCWGPLAILILYELASQQHSPLWAQGIAYLFLSSDFVYLSPWALIRFNKRVKRDFFAAVLPEFTHQWRIVKFLFGKK